MRPYIVAIVIGAAIMVAGYLFYRSTFGELEARVEQARQRLREQKANGTLPEHLKDLDPDKLTLENSQMTLPTNMQIRLDLCLWLRDFWFVFARFILIVCLGGAYLWVKLFGRRPG